MVLTKKAGRLIIIYSLAAVLVMGGFLLRVSRERDALKLAGAVSYDHAFAELNQAVGSLDTSIRKTLCAASPSMISAVCAQGYAQSAAGGQGAQSDPGGAPGPDSPGRKLRAGVPGLVGADGAAAGRADLRQ